MVLEQELPRFSAWIGPAVLAFLLTAGIVVLAVGLIAWLVQSLACGPLEAGDRVYRGVLTGLGDLRATSLGRVWALARLAIQEAVRRNVLLVLLVFAVVILFAGWFLDPTNVDPGRLYLGFILGAMNLLVCMVTLILAAFSLPADIKSKAIQTVTTKPVRTAEIVLGRFLGFALVGTGLLAVMGLAGWAFVVRSVDHSHELPPGAVVEVRDEEGTVTGFEGRTSPSRGHRHFIALDAEGRGVAETFQGHRHRITPRTVGADRAYEVGPPEGILEARRPLRGRLRFLDRQGQPAEKGISVGAEWAYRQYIEGGTGAAAVWTFEGLTEEAFPDGLPLEMTIRVFRTYKGTITEGIHGTIQIRNPVNQLRSEAFPIVAREFTIDEFRIPRKLGTVLADGQVREADLFADFIADGRVEVWLQCLEPAQYYGVAPADFYLRAGEGSFAFNYAKGCLGAWFAMLIVTALGVMFSTFLSAPVALVASLSVLLIGQFREFIARLFTSQVTGDATIAPGGGPIESLYRIVTQTSITLELDPTPGVQAMKLADTVLLAPMRVLAGLFPSLSTLGTSDFVAGGFDIPAGLLAAHALETLAYVAAFCIAGAFCLRAREVAS
jgi:ABC-type transport system involved in multi-copper enzyme maturation permease subunit